MYDYHTHSFFSGDCDTPLTNMIESAIFKGLKEIAVTDHFDPDYHDNNFSFIPDFDKYHEALLTYADRYKKRIRLVKGIEIGIQDSVIDEINETAAAFGYDFIIGSFHSSCGVDVMKGDFFEGRDLKSIYIDYYTYMFDCLKKFNNFDVLGHMNFFERYLAMGIGLAEDESFYSDIVDEILKHLIDNGKGIEFNTSVYRYMTPVTMPRDFVLRRYRELGGEIITIGSDAHTPEAVAFGFDKAKEILISHGFKYITTFENRKPSFVKL